MYCIIRRQGVDSLVHVNRLTRKYHWTEAMPDTAIWDSEVSSTSEQPPQVTRKEMLPRISEGDTIIFPLEMEAGTRIPFGIGVVLDASDQSNIHYQWLGNASGRADRPFRLCWHQASTDQIYYKETKLHAGHTKGTGSDVAAREVIAYGTDILNSGVKITRRIRQMLEDNPTVQQNWGANDESIFSIGTPEQATNNRDGESENKDEHADSSAERGAEQIIVLFTAEQRPTHHHAGIRIGEAKKPGPETDNPSSYIVVYRDGTIAADVDVYANETTPTPARQFLTASMLLDTGTNPELSGTAEAIHVVAELDAYDQPNAPTSSESKSDSDDEPPPLLMNVQRRPDVPDSDGDMPELVEDTSEEDAPDVDTCRRGLARSGRRNK